MVFEVSDEVIELSLMWQTAVGCIPCILADALCGGRYFGGQL